jgi:hypothetical protein
MKYFPKKLVRRAMMKKAMKRDTPLNWIKNNIKGKIAAFLGSRERWQAIPGWDQFNPEINPPHKKLNHGYNEMKPVYKLTLSDLRQAAEFRGGKCLSSDFSRDDLRTKIKWVCAHGHVFEASSYLILKTGHWCEECLKKPWNIDEQARHNPFIAQVWYADHEESERNTHS